MLKGNNRQPKTYISQNIMVALLLSLAIFMQAINIQNDETNGVDIREDITQFDWVKCQMITVKKTTNQLTSVREESFCIFFTWFCGSSCTDVARRILPCHAPVIAQTNTIHRTITVYNGPKKVHLYDIIVIMSSAKDVGKMTYLHRLNLIMTQERK